MSLNLQKKKVFIYSMLLNVLIAVSLFTLLKCLFAISYINIIEHLFLRHKSQIWWIISYAILLYLVSNIFHEIGHIVSVLTFQDKCLIILRVWAAEVSLCPNYSLPAFLTKLILTLELLSGIVYQTATVTLILASAVLVGDIYFLAAAVLQLLFFLLSTSIYFFKRQMDGRQIINLWMKNTVHGTGTTLSLNSTGLRSQDKMVRWKM